MFQYNKYIDAFIRLVVSNCRLHFLDITRYDCGRASDNPLNIKIQSG